MMKPPIVKTMEPSPTHLFSIGELSALYRIFEKEWINPKDEEAHAVVNRIMSILKESPNG